MEKIHIARHWVVDSAHSSLEWLSGSWLTLNVETWQYIKPAVEVCIRGESVVVAAVALSPDTDGCMQHLS
jgi:hypothetical protein